MGAYIGNGLIFLFSLIGVTEISLTLYSSLFFKHSPHQMLVLSLCSADFFLCLFGVFGVGANLIRGQWAAGQDALSWCLFISGLVVTTVIVSVGSYTFIALERYMVIFHNLSGHENKTKLAIISFWIFAGLGGFYSSNDGQKASLLPSKIACGPSSLHSVLMNVVFAIFAISPFIMAYCYYSIFKYYVRKQSQYRQANEQEALASNPKERQLLYKLSSIAGSFLVLVVPFPLVKFYSLITNTPISSIADIVRTLLLVFNSIVNPVILYIYDPQIKYQLDSIFHIDALLWSTAEQDLAEEYDPNPHEEVYNLQAKDTVRLSL
jgi:hypothetical protein